jgi:hypothetical protein
VRNGPESYGLAMNKFLMTGLAALAAITFTPVAHADQAEYDKVIAQCNALPLGQQLESNGKTGTQNCIDETRQAFVAEEQRYKDCVAAHPTASANDLQHMWCGTDPGYGWLWQMLH